MNTFIKTVISFLKDPEYQNLIFLTSLIIAGGAIAFHYLEGWTWIDSIYFSVITLTTIGYGDFSPQTDAGKLFTIFYILIGLGIILNFIHTVYHHYAKTRTEERQRRQQEINSEDDDEGQ